MFYNRKIFRLTFTTFIGPFIATLFVVTFILLIQFLWKYIDDMVGKGLEWYIILKLMFFASASFIPLALPLSVLLSSIMAFGKLSETYELVAFKSAGISLFRIMRPLIVVVLFICGIAFFFANNLIPKANLKFHSLLYDIRQQRPALDIREGTFYSGIDNYSIRINKKIPKTNFIEGIMIYDHSRNRGADIILTAQKGEMFTTEDQHYLVLNLENGKRYEDMESSTPGRNTYPSNREYFKTYQLKFDLTAFKLNRTREEYFKDHWEMLNVSQLTDYSDSMVGVIDTARKNAKNFLPPYLKYFGNEKFFNDKKSYSKVKPYLPKTYLETIPLDYQVSILNTAISNIRGFKQICDEQAIGISNHEGLKARFDIEWHRKFTLSLACLVLFFIGTPLGSIIRKGGLGLPTVISIFIFLIFYVLIITFEKSAKQVSIDAFWGMWIPFMILFPIGFYLTYKANSDSISFSTNRISTLITWFQRRFKKKLSKNEGISITQ